MIRTPAHPDGRTTDNHHPDPLGARLRGLGRLAVLGAIALLAARLAVFESLVAAAAKLLSTDGIVEQSGRGQLSAILLGASALAAMIGVLLIALGNGRVRAAVDSAVRWDALRLGGLTAPDAYRMLGWSLGLGLAVVAVWAVHGKLGPVGRYLFQKEGPLEHLTFVMELVAAGLCAIAALRWRVREFGSARTASALYGVCGAALFLVGMEEINWGQTLFGFETPAQWAAINYQQETSVHNLIDRPALDAVSQAIAVAFGAGVLFLIAASVRAPASLFGSIAPPPTLAPLALIIAAGAASLHAEVIELLLAIFFVFYSARAFVAARSIVPAPVLEAPDVPLARTTQRANDDRGWWNAELLEYTHDAIIIWEMNGAGVLYWNRAAEQLYGYTRREAHGQITHELLKTQLAGGVDTLERSIARFGIWIGELRHTARDGREVVVDSRLTLLAQRDGRWLVLEVNRDLTDQKGAEAARAAIERQLAELRLTFRPGPQDIAD